MQLVFGRDAILNIAHTANWTIIKDRKQKQILKNNMRENAKRTDHQYKIGDLVLLKNDFTAKYAKKAYSGPFEITQVNNNGTVNLQKGIVNDIFNIRSINPSKTQK